MDFNRTVVTKSPAQTAALGTQVAASLTGSKRGEAKSRPLRVLCLYGELGSGKTTFVQGFAQGLGITSRLLSPTFIIVRRYDVPSISGFLYHIDLYRIHAEGEVVGLGISEILSDSSSFVLIEWADRLGDLLPKRRIDIRCSLSDDGSHTFIMRQSEK